MLDLVDGFKINKLSAEKSDGIRKQGEENLLVHRKPSGFHVHHDTQICLQLCSAFVYGQIKFVKASMGSRVSIFLQIFRCE